MNHFIYNADYQIRMLVLSNMAIFSRLLRMANHQDLKDLYLHDSIVYFEVTLKSGNGSDDTHLHLEYYAGVKYQVSTWIASRYSSM